MDTSIGRSAKHSLDDFIALIDPRLDEYWRSELDRRFGFNEGQRRLVSEMIAHAHEHNIRPAKRLRASFVYYAYLLNRPEIDERIWRVAMSVELVHTALLIHDDFVDEDTSRRGKPTTHVYFGMTDKHYGNSMAVMVGDMVLCAGYQLLVESGFTGTPLVDAMSKMLRGIMDTSCGQAYDISLQRLRHKWSEDDVIALHKAKTSIYTYENPLLIGALLGDLSRDAFPILHNYAMDGGVAFQLQDDILGVFGDPEHTGKSADSDLLQGKATLLVMKVFLEGSNAQVHAVEKVWGRHHATRADIEDAKQAIIDSGSLRYSKAVSREYALRAVKSAMDLRRLQLDTGSITYLQGIAQYMVERDL